MLSIKISKIGVGDGSNRTGIVDVGKDVVVGGIVAIENCVAIGVGDDSATGKPGGTHAVQRIRMKKKAKDFILALR